MTDSVTAKELIESYESLDGFAQHHQNKGIQKAHALIKQELVDKVYGLPRDGSKEALLKDKGYEEALENVFSLLEKHMQIG